MESIMTEKYRGQEIEIYQDEIVDNSPRDWDNLGTMVCFHSRYQLGDKHDYSPEGLKIELAIEACPGIEDLLHYWNDGSGWEKFQSEAKSDAMIEKAVDAVLEKYYVALPLYLYDHSGITMSTTPFSCPWDSGMVGIIFVSIKKLEEEYPSQDASERIESAKKRLISEVKVYDQYIRGEVYGYRIESDLLEESCWGYFGDPEESGLLEDAKQMIDSAIKFDEERKEKMDLFMRTCWAY